MDTRRDVGMGKGLLGPGGAGEVAAGREATLRRYYGQGDRVSKEALWRRQPPLNVQGGGEILGEQVRKQWVLGSASSLQRPLPFC